MTTSEFDYFLHAQKSVYDQVVEELTCGYKRTHWMWFIFPQIKGLGHSTTAQQFAINSLDQAGRYTRHILLGPRLRQCAQLIIDVQGREISQILGHPDELKFCSSMTLFEIAAPEDPLFKLALKKYFAGRQDVRTLEILGLSRG